MKKSSICRLVWLMMNKQQQKQRQVLPQFAGCTTAWMRMEPFWRDLRRGHRRPQGERDTTFVGPCCGGEQTRKKKRSQGE